MIATLLSSHVSPEILKLFELLQRSWIRIYPEHMVTRFCLLYHHFPPSDRNSRSRKQIGTDQELIQSDPISAPQNQKGKKYIHTLTTVHKRRARET